MANDSSNSSAQLAILVLGSIAAVLSATFTITGLLELLVILGPVSLLGNLRISSWWSLNLLLLVVWLPLLGIAGWQLHDAVWQDAIPFLAMGAFFIVTHMLLLFCYWLRWLLRKQAAKELPTQELLTEAQRVMMATGCDLASPTPGRHTGPDDPRFQLQVGRTDGVRGFTLYIPAEEEEAVYKEVAQRHFYRRQTDRYAVQSGPASPNARHGPANGTLFTSGAVRSSAASFRDVPEALSATMASPQRRTGSAGGDGSAVPDTARGLVTVALPDTMGVWKSQRTSSHRYRGPSESVVSCSVTAVDSTTVATSGHGEVYPQHVRAQSTDQSFGFGVTGIASEASARQLKFEPSAVSRGSVAGSGNTLCEGNSSVVEGSNPLFGSQGSLCRDLSLNPGQAEAVVAAAMVSATNERPASSPAPASRENASTAPSSISGNGDGGAASAAAATSGRAAHSGLWQGIMSRHSMDPELLIASATPSSSGRRTFAVPCFPTPSAERLLPEAQWPRSKTIPKAQLITAPATVGSQNPTAAAATGAPHQQQQKSADSASAGLLDDAQRQDRSSTPVAESPNPRTRSQQAFAQRQHFSSSSAGGDGSNSAGHAEAPQTRSGLLSGRLWCAHHTRTRSFPLATSLTSALLNEPNGNSSVVEVHTPRKDPVI